MLASMEECALGMVQSNFAEEGYALLMDAHIKSFKEECAIGMVQRSHNAVSRDAQFKLEREECV